MMLDKGSHIRLSQIPWRGGGGMRVARMVDEKWKGDAKRSPFLCALEYDKDVRGDSLLKSFGLTISNSVGASRLSVGLDQLIEFKELSGKKKEDKRVEFTFKNLDKKKDNIKFTMAFLNEVHMQHFLSNICMLRGDDLWGKMNESTREKKFQDWTCDNTVHEKPENDSDFVQWLKLIKFQAVSRGRPESMYEILKSRGELDDLLNFFQEKCKGQPNGLKNLMTELSSLDPTILHSYDTSLSVRIRRQLFKHCCIVKYDHKDGCAAETMKREFFAVLKKKFDYETQLVESGYPNLRRIEEELIYGHCRYLWDVNFCSSEILCMTVFSRDLKYVIRSWCFGDKTVESSENRVDLICDALENAVDQDWELLSWKDHLLPLLETLKEEDGVNLEDLEYDTFLLSNLLRKKDSILKDSMKTPTEYFQEKDKLKESLTMKSLDSDTIHKLERKELLKRMKDLGKKNLKIESRKDELEIQKLDLEFDDDDDDFGSDDEEEEEEEEEKEIKAERIINEIADLKKKLEIGKAEYASLRKDLHSMKKKHSSRRKEKKKRVGAGGFSLEMLEQLELIESSIEILLGLGDGDEELNMKRLYRLQVLDCVHCNKTHFELSNRRMAAISDMMKGMLQSDRVKLYDMGVKLVISTNGTPPNKNMKVAGRAVLKAKKVLPGWMVNPLRFGFFHTSVMIKNVQFHWLSDELVHLVMEEEDESTKGYFDLTCIDTLVPMMCSGESLGVQIRKIALSIVKTNFENSYHMFSDECRKTHNRTKFNCQEFCLRMLRYLNGEKDVVFYPKIRKYFKKLVQNNFKWDHKKMCDLLDEFRFLVIKRKEAKTFRKPKRYLKKMVRIEGKKKILLKEHAFKFYEKKTPEDEKTANHKDLDEFTIRLNEDRTGVLMSLMVEDPGMWHLLKGFDRAFWIMMRKHKSSKNLGMKLQNLCFPKFGKDGTSSDCPFSSSASDMFDNIEEKERMIREEKYLKELDELERKKKKKEEKKKKKEEKKKKKEEKKKRKKDEKKKKKKKVRKKKRGKLNALFRSFRRGKREEEEEEEEEEEIVEEKKKEEEEEEEDEQD